MCNNNDQECKCIAEILKVIMILQQNASCSDSCLDSCDRGFLGCSTASLNCNTRPIMLYTASSNGTPWRMPTTKEAISCTDATANCSSVFRIEKLDDCCGTFRVLAENTDPETSGLYPYVATNSLFTMNLKCICCLRCLNDTYIECI